MLTSVMCGSTKLLTLDSITHLINFTFQIQHSNTLSSLLNKYPNMLINVALNLANNKYCPFKDSGIL